MQLDIDKIASFCAIIWSYYQENGRSFVWRHVADPYKIVVSEVMLQQTQTYRVEEKYTAFITALPNFQALSDAPLRTVLSLWQGLGYNRRALYLQRLAQIVSTTYNGVLPACPQTLNSLPGIGKATAASICAFAFNMPTIFIETNIRSVFMFHFFPEEKNVSDTQLYPLVQATLDYNRPRDWYYALMDYGVMLKKTGPNPSRRSKHHTVQSRFEGSDRQIRGSILRLLTKHPVRTQAEIIDSINKDQERIERILTALCNEGFLEYVQSGYRLSA